MIPDGYQIDVMVKGSHRYTNSPNGNPKIVIATDNDRYKTATDCFQPVGAVESATYGIWDMQVPVPFTFWLDRDGRVIKAEIREVTV
jgi:hypothetical protein